MTYVRQDAAEEMVALNEDKPNNTKRRRSKSLPNDRSTVHDRIQNLKRMKQDSNIGYMQNITDI